MGRLKKGYIQVYTGRGKGKTTAALGLALRAAGAGLKVLIAQFIKRGNYSEIKALERFSDLITVAQFGRGRLIIGTPPSECVQKAHVGLECVRSCILSRNYDVVILEEANVALSYGFLSIEDLLDIIDLKPNDVELVITGRGAPDEIIERADLVTEMNPIKHYYDRGVRARVGIEK